MGINISQLSLKILNLQNHLETFMDFIYKKQLVIKILKQDKSNMFKNGWFLWINCKNYYNKMVS